MEKIKQAIKKTNGVLIIGFYALIVIMLIIGKSKKGTNKPEDNNTPTPSPTTISEQSKNYLSNTFCAERSGEYIRAVDLNDFLKMVEEAPKVTTLRPAKEIPPTKDVCQKITTVCLNLWNKEDCEKIAERKIWIGMSKDQLILSWGLPDDQNNTVGSWGINSQWVYGLGDYVYLEGESDNDLRVTSWQD